MHKQNALFQYFSDTFDHLIEIDKKEGRYDMGILGKLPARAGVQALGAPHGIQGQYIVYLKSTVEKLQTRTRDWSKLLSLYL